MVNRDAVSMVGEKGNELRYIEHLVRETMLNNAEVGTERCECHRWASTSIRHPTSTSVIPISETNMSD